MATLYTEQINEKKKEKKKNENAEENELRMKIKAKSLPTLSEENCLQYTIVGKHVHRLLG